MRERKVSSGSLGTCASESMRPSRKSGHLPEPDAGLRFKKQESTPIVYMTHQCRRRLNGSQDSQYIPHSAFSTVRTGGTRRAHICSVLHDPVEPRVDAFPRSKVRDTARRNRWVRVCRHLGQCTSGTKLEKGRGASFVTGLQACTPVHWLGDLPRKPVKSATIIKHDCAINPADEPSGLCRNKTLWTAAHR